MKSDIAQFLQVTVLMIWNLFPNGTMLFASWFSNHWPGMMLRDFEEEGEDDFWFPLSQK